MADSTRSCRACEAGPHTCGLASVVLRRQDIARVYRAAAERVERYATGAVAADWLRSTADSYDRSEVKHRRAEVAAQVQAHVDDIVGAPPIVRRSGGVRRG